MQTLKRLLKLIPDLMFESKISLFYLATSLQTSPLNLLLCAVCLLSQNTHLTSPHLQRRNVILISFTRIVFVSPLCYKSDQGSCNFSPSLLTAVSPSLQLQSNLLTVTKPACCSNLSLYIYHISAFLCPAQHQHQHQHAESNAYHHTNFLLCLACYLPAICLPSQYW